MAGPFGHHERELSVRDRLSVERAILPSSGFARAKTILSADEEGQTFLKPTLVRRKEAHQPAEMVVMTVAQHQCIEAGGVDLQDRHVVEERLRLIAKIDQNVPHLASTP